MSARTTPGVIAVFVVLTAAGCIGTFQTARVSPFRLGPVVHVSSGTGENTLTTPGLFLECGWPASSGKFGIGFNFRLLAGLEEGTDTAFLGVWGLKLQLPENGAIDTAVALDLWAYYPGEINLLLSRRFGMFEPYASIGIANFLGDGDSGDLSIFGGGILTLTGGTMVRLGRDPHWLLGAEVETGSAWMNTSFGLALLREC